MKHYKMDVKLKGLDEEDIKVPVHQNASGVTDEWGDTPADIFKLILLNSPMKTQNDSIQGTRLYQAIKEAENNWKAYQEDSAKAADAVEPVLNIEDGVYDWFCSIADQITPPLFRLNGNIVYKFIKDGFIKAHAPTPEKAKV